MTFIAVDWGTTNCRAYRTSADGTAVHAYRSPLGILSVPKGAFPDVLARIRSELGADLPVLIAGMAGSNRGWFEAPYVDAPAGAGDLADAAIAVPGAPGVRIVPGVRMAAPHRSDVMRGEETQIMGAGVADGLCCLPGTHTKWAVLARGRIQSFATVMAGEIFHLLRTQSILKGSLPSEPPARTDNDGFLTGLAAAKRARFLSDAFAVRPFSLLDQRSPEWCDAYLSGLTIGADVREAAPQPGTTVHVIGAETLAPLYADAIRAAGAIPAVVDGAAAFALGASRIFAHLSNGGGA